MQRDFILQYLAAQGIVMPHNEKALLIERTLSFWSSEEVSVSVYDYKDYKNVTGGSYIGCSFHLVHLNQGCSINLWYATGGVAGWSQGGSIESPTI